MINTLTGKFRESVVRNSNLFIAVAFALSGFMPIILSSEANAAQLTGRSVTIETSQPDAEGVDYTFKFSTTGTDVDVQSMVFTFCTAPLGTCTLPGGAGAGKLNVSRSTVAPGTFTGTQPTQFTEYGGVDAGACTDADGGVNLATQYCVTRTETLEEAAGAKEFTITDIHNPTIPSGNNLSIYVRVTLYSDTAFATEVHDGTVAASIVNQLSVTGRIQERLVFCVFALDDAAGSGAVGAGAGQQPTDCSATEANASTSVDIGVIDNLSIARSPTNNAPPTSLGNDRFGAAIVNTNASSGVAMTYYASAATSGTEELRAFRVPGATCVNGGTSLVDQCFVSADDSAGETFTAGTERFGIQLACVANSDTAAGRGTTSNLGKNGSGVYTAGTGSGGSFNTVYDAGRANLDDDTAGDDCENGAGVTLTDKYGWRDSATAQPLISSTTVVDDEMVKFRLAATANATTPTGTYTVASTYIATPTF
jgi:hypothetical protein